MNPMKFQAIINKKVNRILSLDSNRQRFSATKILAINNLTHKMIIKNKWIK